MKQPSFFDDIFVDCFAGGGGASTGIELATGREVTIAINHDESAIMMHKMNHPYTEHYQEDIWMLDPEELCGERHVKLAWFSPDCKHFSRAKGKALKDRHIRGLAWVVLRWGAKVKPDVIMMENVPEFVTWGPVRKGKPVKSKIGETYHKWLSQLSALGYVIETKELIAADYGAPTSRKRFALIARRDGKPVTFPKPTHGKPESKEVRSGKLLPYRTAAEVIDWSHPSPSIFDGKKEIKEKYGLIAVRPLRENTMKRIAHGLDKFVLKSGNPFIVPIGYGEAKGQDPRVQSIHSPLTTIVASNKHFICDPIVSPFIAEQKFQNAPQSAKKPLSTITAVGSHELISPFLSQYFSNGKPLPVDKPKPTITTLDREAITTAFIAEFKGQDIGQQANRPLRTITTSAGTFGIVNTNVVKYEEGSDLGRWPYVRNMLNIYCDYNLKDDEVLLININDVDYYIKDIGLRMFTPRELYDAQGFPHDYIIDHDNKGNPINRSDQVARCGNSVCPPMAEACVRANLPKYATSQISDMKTLHKVQAS